MVAQVGIEPTPSASKTDALPIELLSFKKYFLYRLSSPLRLDAYGGGLRYGLMDGIQTRVASFTGRGPRSLDDQQTGAQGEIRTLKFTGLSRLPKPFGYLSLYGGAREIRTLYRRIKSPMLIRT